MQAIVHAIETTDKLAGKLAATPYEGIGKVLLRHARKGYE
jgi:hypothetical protein